MSYSQQVKNTDKTYFNKISSNFKTSQLKHGPINYSNANSLYTDTDQVCLYQVQG